jgi:hypothetical protein
MKKLAYFTIVVAMLLALLPATAFGLWEGGYTISPKILAGQTNWVGNVKITGNPDGTITFDFMMKGGQGYCMTDWALHAGLSLADFPTNNGGAIPGQFDYHSTFTGCITSDSITIDPPGVWGDPVYLAIHVNVWQKLPDGTLVNQQTGWTVRCGNLEGAQVPGNNWSAWILFPTAAWFPPAP